MDRMIGVMVRGCAEGTMAFGHPKIMRPPFVSRTLSFALAAIASNLGYASDAHTADLIDLSLEELSTIEVTSVSKRAERLAEAPASIFVITRGDIRSSRLYRGRCPAGLAGQQRHRVVADGGESV